MGLPTQCFLERKMEGGGDASSGKVFLNGTFHSTSVFSDTDWIWEGPSFKEKTTRFA